MTIPNDNIKKKITFQYKYSMIKTLNRADDPLKEFKTLKGWEVRACKVGIWLL